MLLSVVVPCHNEEAVLPRLVEEVLAAVPASTAEVEIVLCDDGSRDRTLAVAQQLHEADERVKYVSLSRNFGKESAMLAGLAYARGDAVVIMDADLQHPPRLIEGMIAKYREGYDQVVARRTRDGDSVARTALSRLYYRLANSMVEVELQDGVGDFRLLSRRAVDALLQMGEYNRFSKGLFSWIGFPTVTLDYENEARQGGGETKWSMRRLLNYGLDGIMSFNNAPLRLAIYAGLAVTVLAFGYAAFVVINALAQGISVPGYVTLVAAVLGIGGLQLLFLGVVGEYVGRIYFETKQRPHYILADVSDDDRGVRVSRSDRAPVRERIEFDGHLPGAAATRPAPARGTGASQS